MEKIDKLTKEQIAAFPKYREKWIKIGLSTKPIDFEKAKEAVIRVYQEVNLTPPGEFHYACSPIAGLETVYRLTGEKINHPYTTGCHDAAWLSFYDFMLTELKIEECNKLVPLMELAKVCGWWIPFDKMVVIEDRPTKIVFDNNNLSHNEKGASIEYSDGFSVFSWHGVKIPEEWIISRDKLTPEVAIAENNLELRRIACEIVGWDNILNKLSSVVIDRNKDPQIGELIEVDIPSVGRERFLRVICGTGRKFALPVPPEMKTALEANAWTYGLGSLEYKPECRT